MVDLEKILPTDDDETYVKHTYLIVVLWIVFTLIAAILFAAVTL